MSAAPSELWATGASGPARAEGGDSPALVLPRCPPRTESRQVGTGSPTLRLSGASMEGHDVREACPVRRGFSQGASAQGPGLPATSGPFWGGRGQHGHRSKAWAGGALPVGSALFLGVPESWAAST